MNVRRAGELVLGSITVYVAVAACSGGSNSDNGLGPNNGGPNGNGDDDSGSGLLNPVGEAHADQSGTRLKARFYAGEDGAKQYIPGSMHDSTRNEDCTFQTASDGKVRCLPSGTESSILYTNSSCSDGHEVFASDCPVKLWQGAKTLGHTCSEQTATVLYEVGEQYTGAYVYLKFDDNTCQQEDASTFYSGVSTWYKRGAEVPASTFAAATIQTDP